MKSLLLGEKSDFYLDKSLYISMSRAGIMHVVAISGMHISFLAGCIQLLFGRSKKSAVASIVLIWLFVILAGFPFSAIRAAIMQTICLLAPILKRENDTGRSLLLSFIIIELIWPKAVLDVGFQLSFGAMAGIMLFATPIYERIHAENRILQYFAGILSSSLACMVFTVPLTAWHFSSIQILSPITNIFVLFAVSLCFCGGWFSLIPGIGKLIAVPVSFVAKYILFVAKCISAIPFSCIYTKETVALFWILLVYLLVVISIVFHGRWFVPLIGSIVSLALMLGISKLSYENYQGVFSVIDVGQGQSIAVMNRDQTVLVDCGGDYSAGMNVGEYLLSCGRNSVDLLVFTHLHADHMNGLDSLYQYVNIQEIVIPAYGDNNPDYLRLIETLANEHGTLISYLKSDSYANIGEIHVEMYSPEEGESENEACAITLVSVGDYSMLVTGDSSSSREENMIDTLQPKDLDLLIVGHHGSRSSSSLQFLQSVNADIAVISTGENRYGHPTQETLDRLEENDYRIYRTDLNGTVEIKLS